MGSNHSRISRERECQRLVIEKENLRRAREEQLQEALRLEKEKNRIHRAREDLAVKALEAQILQEALKRSNAEADEQKLQEAVRRCNYEAQSQLYPNLNFAGQSRNETYQTTAAPNLAVNHDHFRFQPSAPPALFGPIVHQSLENRAPPPRPCSPTIHKPATKTDAAAPQASTRLIKCPNSADGCRLSFKISEITKHEKECPFKERKCPAYGNCNWRGKISQLSIHFDENHPFSRQANVDTEMYLPNIDNEYNSVQLIKMGSYHFLFYVRISEREGRLCMAIQLIGTKVSASKWYYEIHVYNKREPRRKYQYVDSCHSSDETSGISLRSCAELPLPYAKSFVNEGKFTYKLFIKKNNFNERQN